MRVAVIFDADTSLPDPDAGHPEGIVRGEFFPPGTDIVIVYREWGEQFKGGSRIHMIADGAWANLGIKHLKKIEKIMGAL